MESRFGTKEEKQVKMLWNNFKVAFAMFSKIPMPRADWTKENMKYMFCFFPFIGTVIGGLTMLVAYLGLRFGYQPGFVTAVLVLVIYNQFILIQSFTDGFTSVDAGVLEAAVGMGMTKGQIFRKVRLPLALDTMIAGVHISIISTIGIATIASTVGAGGLGTILFDGMRTQNVVKIVWGTFLSVVMVLGVNGILKLIEKRLKKKLYQE